MTVEIQDDGQQLSHDHGVPALFWVPGEQGGPPPLVAGFVSAFQGRGDWVRHSGLPARAEAYSGASLPCSFPALLPPLRPSPEWTTGP